MGKDRAVTGRGRQADLTPEEVEKVLPVMRELQGDRSHKWLGDELGCTGVWIGQAYRRKRVGEKLARAVARAAKKPDGFWRNNDGAEEQKSATEAVRVRWIAHQLGFKEAELQKLWRASAVRGAT